MKPSSKKKGNLKGTTNQNFSSSPKHRKKFRLELLSKAKMTPQRMERKMAVEWMKVQILFPPPKLWEATARQTSRYLWRAIATGTRLFQVVRIIRKMSEMAQSWLEPSIPQDEMLRKYAPMFNTLTRQSHIKVHEYSISWLTVPVVLSSNFRHISILRLISETGAERWRPTML